VLRRAATGRHAARHVLDEPSVVASVSAVPAAAAGQRVVASSVVDDRTGEMINLHVVPVRPVYEADA